jgi:cyanophycinase-like exopeptidase
MGPITLLGAGELMSSMSRVHRDALARCPQPSQPVFLDVTAGFETNVDAIADKAVEYYQHHLQTDLAVARYRHRDLSSAAEIAAAVAEIRHANMIFAGPGSPTYAIRHWRDTPVWEAVTERFEAGAHVFFASAAAITLGRYSLPVYEIYKAGQDPFWTEGLDLLGQMGLNFAVVPHFDDSSGGENYDTRFCYMGARRFEILQDQLPEDVTILGIDAYTALCFDPEKAQALVSGQGSITVIGDGDERIFPAGTVIPFDDLRSSSRRTMHAEVTKISSYAFTDNDEPAVDDPFEPLTSFVEEHPSLSDLDKIELIARLQGLRRQVESAPSNHEDALLDLLVDLRSALRQLKRFDLADQARDILNELGIEVNDSPQGSSWSRR